MSSAMKKLKLLHTINTTPTHRDPQNNASSTALNSSSSQYHHKLPTTPPSSHSSPTDKPKRPHRSRIPVPVYYQQHLTPPISPTGSSVSNSAPPSPHQQQRHRTAVPALQHRQDSAKYYAEMLRSARQALHQLQHHHPHAPAAQQAIQQQQQQQRSIYPVLAEITSQNHQQQQKRVPALPGGAFLVLTQDDPHPGICIPNSPVVSVQQQHQRQAPLPVNTPLQQFTATGTSGSRSAVPHTPNRSTRRKPPPLTRSAVELILQDTRVARWQRIQAYVRDQRKLVIVEEEDQYSRGSRAGTVAENPLEGTVPLANIYADIDRKNKALDELDRLSEIKARSLWSGGSAGTNGVDEFVWDDDEEGFVGDADMLDVDDWSNRERPGTAGSGSGSPGYRRQSIGRGNIAGKTGSFGSVDGAVFRMDGEMEVEASSRQTPTNQRPTSSPSYTNPTFSFLGKTRRSPSASPMDKGLREYMEALRRRN
ncbi:hypothetical protein BDZ91DRAFT_495958 [Kalaharituber pfeilii]|nr:hypothetical protein BDZ91DRAFT_495958 [Kalaharituber pfeilii]